MKKYFHKTLKCWVERLSYDFRTQIGEVRLPEIACCDMSGCVGVFTAIDPDVRQIQVFAGDQLDGVYTREEKGGGIWHAYRVNGWVAGL